MKKQFLFQTFFAFLLLAGPALASLTWDINTVDNSAGGVGRDTSIALDAGDNAHISYYDFTNYDLKYAYAYCGYVLDGDRNDDCKVDFRDFAAMTKNWLIDCDKTPGDPACVPK
jgi:hypothetical protein